MKSTASHLEAEHNRLRSDLIKWYRASLAKIEPSSNPDDLHAVINAGVKLISFVQASPSKFKSSPTIPEDLESAFSALSNAQPPSNP